MHLPGDGLELILVSAAKSVLGLNENRSDSKGNHANSGLIADSGGEDVVVAGILKVELEGLDGAESAHSSDGSEAKEGKHGKAGVLDLLQASLSRVHACGVLELVVASLLIALGAESLKDNESGDADQELSLDVDVVFLGTCSPPVTLSEEISDEDAGNSGHSPATVDDLSVLEVLEELGLGAEAEGIEAIVCGMREN